MIIAKQRDRIARVYHEYPRQFWLLMVASFIDFMGRALVAIFLALYITEKFDVGLTRVGLMYAIFSITGLIGSFIGGALTDKLGRKGIIIFSLVMSAISSLALGFINDLNILYGVLFIAGLLSETGGPAVHAMSADILPEEKRAEGFSIWRVSINLSWIIAPVLGSVLVSDSYVPIFIFDAVTSCVMAGFVFLLLSETKPETSSTSTAEPTLGNTFWGYTLVLRDVVFMAFVVVNMLVQLVYLQLYSTLPVYLRDQHGLPGHHFGYLMSTNAALVVLTQVWVARRIRNQPPLLMLAVGCLFFVVGYSMYGIVAGFALFVVAMMFVTIGEMIIFPLGQTVVAQMSPEDMRGRYMALYGFSFAIPSAIGTWLAGQVTDNIGPNWVWYLAGTGAMIASLAYAMLYTSTKATATHSEVAPAELVAETA